MSLSRRGFLSTEALLLAQLPTLAQEALPDAAKQEVWVRTELYFGTNKPGGTVSDGEFNTFVGSEVKRLFPQGLTLLSGRGQSTSARGVAVSEKAHLLILLYPPGMPEANSRIEEIRDRYKRLHQQESVLRTDSVSFVSF